MQENQDLFDGHYCFKSKQAGAELGQAQPNLGLIKVLLAEKSMAIAKLIVNVI